VRFHRLVVGVKGGFEEKNSGNAAGHPPATLRVVVIVERGKIARPNNRGCARKRSLISGPSAVKKPLRDGAPGYPPRKVISSPPPSDTHSSSNAILCRECLGVE